MNFSILIRSLFDRKGVEAAQRDLSGLGSSAGKAADQTKKIADQTHGLNRALHATQSLARGDIFGAMSQAAEGLKTKFSQVGASIAGALGAFSIGWQIGAMIRDITGLGKALDKLLVPAPIIAKSISQMASEKLAGLQAELEAVKVRLDALSGAADKAVERIATVLNQKAAEQTQAGLQAELAASPEQRPIVAAQNQADEAATRVAVAANARIEHTKAARQAESEIATLRKRLADAEAKKAFIENSPKPAGGKRSQEELAEWRAQTNAITALNTSIEAAIEKETNLKERLVKAETELTYARTARIKSEYDLAAAIKTAADARAKADASAAAGAAQSLSEARAKAEQAQYENETPERQLNYLRNKAQSVLAEARGESGPVSPARKEELKAEYLALVAKANAIRARPGVPPADIAKRAADQRTIADQAAASAEAARARMLDPQMAAQQDRQARKDAEKKQAEQKQITNLLRQARASGYAAIETQPGEFSAVRNRRILGTISPRLAEAVVADAKAKFAAQQKARAEALELAAKQAQVNAEILLQQIAQNTKAGPIV